MDRASQDGLILIEGSGPTYATATVSLSAASFFASLSIFHMLLFTVLLIRLYQIES